MTSRPSADKPITGTWRTKGGVRVVSRGPVQIREGKEKLACYKERTGGFHGWLRVSQLTKVPGVKPGKASAS